LCDRSDRRDLSSRALATRRHNGSARCSPGAGRHAVRSNLAGLAVDRFAAQIQGSFDAELGGPFDPPVEGLTPIESTGFEITYQGDSPGVGIVLIDPNEPADLLRYWNLRASGGNVLPWPLGHERLIERFARSWIL